MTMNAKHLMTFLAVLLLADHTYAQQSQEQEADTQMGAPAEAEAPKDQNTIFGVWATERVPEEGEDTIAHIKIEPCKNDKKKACGKIVWSEVKTDPETGKPPLDKNNSEESLRSRPIMCLEIMHGFTSSGSQTAYEDGELYSSRTGKTYTGEMKLIDPNHLKLRGSVLFGLVGRETTWTRVKNPGKDPCK